MAIEKKSLKDMSSGIRAVYQKARDVISKNSLDYGIELLKSILEKEPGFTEARRELRDAEKQKFDSMNGVAKFIASIKVNKYIIQGKACLGKKPLDAMARAEDALAVYLKSPAALNLLSDAALAAEAPFVAAEALETLHEFEPENESNLNTLANIYESMGEGVQMLRIRQMLADKHPDDLEIQAGLRAAAALATMEQGRWNDKGGSIQERVKSEKDEEKVVQGDRIVRAVDDINDMIVHYEKQIEKGEPSIDLYRKLAELYLRAERYEEAINAYNWIAERMGTLDPAIDKAIERCNVAIARKTIEDMKAAGESAERIAEAEKQVYDYRLERYEERVRLYPNDLQLRYDLAELYWEGQEIDKALEQFQQAQRNPQRRLMAMVYLGRCFSAKHQYDMAVEQFSKSIAEMPVMDKDKMHAMYYLGVSYEQMGDAEKAMDCFKQIYSVNVNYLDVGERMNVYYAKSSK